MYFIPQFHYIEKEIATPSISGSQHSETQTKWMQKEGLFTRRRLWGNAPTEGGGRTRCTVSILTAEKRERVQLDTSGQSSPLWALAGTPRGMTYPVGAVGCSEPKPALQRGRGGGQRRLDPLYLKHPFDAKNWFHTGNHRWLHFY